MVDSVTGDQGRAAIPPEVLAEALRALGIAPKAPAPKAPGPEDYAHVAAQLLAAEEPARAAFNYALPLGEKPTAAQPANSNAKPAEVIDIAGGAQALEREGNLEDARQLLKDIMKMDGETKARLTGQILQLQSAISSGKITEGQLKEIREIIEREQKTSEREKGDETPQAKVDRLWGEIGKLNEKTAKTFDELSEFSTEEEKKRHKELRELIEKENDEEKRREYQAEYDAIEKTVFKRVQENTPATDGKHKKAKEAERLVDERDRLIGQIVEIKNAQTKQEVAKSEVVMELNSMVTKLGDITPSSIYEVASVANTQSGALGRPDAPKVNNNEQSIGTSF